MDYRLMAALGTLLLIVGGFVAILSAAAGNSMDENRIVSAIAWTMIAGGAVMAARGAAGKRR